MLSTVVHHFIVCTQKILAVFGVNEKNAEYTEKNGENLNHEVSSRSEIKERKSFERNPFQFIASNKSQFLKCYAAAAVAAR